MIKMIEGNFIMIKSMTGFGRGKYENEGRFYTVEIKSVNHKYSDISIKMPRFLNSFEDKIRKRILEEISRGKVDVYITFENYSSIGTNIHFNIELAKEYIKGLKELANETKMEYNINLVDLSKMPEILKLQEDENEEIIGKELMFALDEAMNNFIQMRQLEGEKLIYDMLERLKFIEEKVSEIEKYSKTLVKEYMQKLETRVKEMMNDKVVDENRLAQEIVIFSDKSSIEEELIRLKSHILQFKNFAKGTSPIGKKIDFLIQEMNREVNTIGSKANCLEITNRVIDLKTEIENIREQVQNIE